MAIFRTQHNKNYTCINNHICTDKRLSWKAKGLWLYAFSRPDDWTFHMCDLINQSVDGRDAVRAGLRELERAGYLARSQLREGDGRMGDSEWIFYEIPQAVQPKGRPEETAKTAAFRRRKPLTGFPLTVIRPLLSTESQLIPEKAKTVNDSPLRGEDGESLPFRSGDLSSTEAENIQETQKDTERPRESKMDSEATRGLADARRALKREQKDVLDAPADVALSCGEDDESLPFRSGDKKDTERPQESTIDNEVTRGLAGIRYPLKREQIPLFEALTALDLGCALKTLYILIRSHTPQALADAMHHLRHEDTQGKKIKNRIGLLRATLAGKICPITELVAKNKKLCVEKARDMSWHSLDIREKCVVCTATQKELSLSMPAEEFFNALKSLYELGRSYRKSAPESFDLGYDDGSEED